MGARHLRARRVLHEMLAGRRPFEADSTLATLDAS